METPRALDGTPPSLQTRRSSRADSRSALQPPEADISSEDEGPDTPGLENDDIRNTIAVSIGQEQARLASPNTPAVEKQVAIEREGGFFGNLDGAVSQKVRGDQLASRRSRSESPRPHRGSSNEVVLLPSPWKAGPRTFQKDRDTEDHKRNGRFDGLSFYRRRASPGPETWFEGWQKSFRTSLPLRNFYRHGSGDVEQTARRQLQPEHSDSAVSTPMAPSPSKDSFTLANSRPGQIRRTISDQSLVTQRSHSQVESLGDDSRFEDVQAQINNRFKALKDSWADSSIKIPSLPKTFTPGFLRSFGASQASLGHSGAAASRKHLSMPTRPSTSDGGTTNQPGPMREATASQPPTGKASRHTALHRALDTLQGDVVVLGGYRGSILNSAKPPNEQLWIPLKAGLNMRKVNLEVGLEQGDDEREADRVISSGMLTHIGPVDVSRRLLKRLRASENALNGNLRVHDYGYDWRLDPTLLSKQLVDFVAQLTCNQSTCPLPERGATIIAHSLGGLVTRHAVNQRPQLFRGVVYAGVPGSSCVNILGPLRNGEDVLLSSRVLTAQVNFTIRTSFALLPLDGRCFLDRHTGEEYPVDFFDPQEWVRYRLSPCVAEPLAALHPQPKSGGITKYVNSMTSSLPSLPLPGRKGIAKTADLSKVTAILGATEPEAIDIRSGGNTGNVADSNISPSDDAVQSSRTAVTIPPDKAVEYLTRTLASIKRFRQQLDVDAAHAAANRYPPVAVMYGKSTPTVYGAKVDGREAIKHADAYDELAFASGDGVVLARAAQLPPGYKAARGGIVSSARGHVTLLGDLEGVGKCLNALERARRSGVGLGP